MADSQYFKDRRAEGQLVVTGSYIHIIRSGLSIDMPVTEIPKFELGAYIANYKG
jgi:hypothetical protein